MKNYEEEFQLTSPPTSRRRFTKSLVGMLAAAPAIATISACRREDSPQRSAAPAASASPGPLPRIVSCLSGAAIEPHEPPIGFEDGSLVITVPLSNKVSNIAQGTGPRPYKHTLGVNLNYTSINEVRVMTRPINARPIFKRYLLPPNPAYQLRIYLVQLSSMADLQNLYDAPAPEPHLILKPTAPHIEAGAALVESLSHKRGVPYRYDYPPLDRPFHIGQWQITDEAGEVVQDAQTDDLFQDSLHDSYEIFVSFNHP